MRTLYFVAFYDNPDSPVPQFYKFGQCAEEDARLRFKHEPEQYKKWKIKVIACARGTQSQVDSAERVLMSKFPKNLFVNQKFSGITEIVKLNKTDEQRVLNAFKKINRAWCSTS